MNMIRKYDPSSQEDRIELAQNILRSLHDRGFEYKSGGGPSAELVFEKVNERGLCIHVFTTIVETARGNEVRALGKDAIRVILSYIKNDGVLRGLGKERRVFRTGDIPGVIQRLNDRIDQTVARSNSPESCEKCGAPKFESKSGNLVCSEICWDNQDALRREFTLNVESGGQNGNDWRVVAIFAERDSEGKWREKRAGLHSRIFQGPDARRKALNLLSRMRDARVDLGDVRAGRCNFLPHAE